MDFQPKSPLKRSVLREDIKNYLIDAIMRGVYQTGERLVETQIAKELGVSQAPVREAFRDLEQAGLLKTVPYKGAFVKGYSLQDLRNAYDVRAELEGLAIRLALPQITAEELNRLEAVYNKMLQETDIKRQALLDVEFHEIIIKASRNSLLETAWKSVSVTHWTYFGLYKFSSVDLVRRHESIIEAFRAKDVEMAISYMRKHFLELKEMVN